MANKNIMIYISQGSISAIIFVAKPITTTHVDHYSDSAISMLYDVSRSVLEEEKTTVIFEKITKENIHLICLSY